MVLNPFENIPKAIHRSLTFRSGTRSHKCERGDAVSARNLVEGHLCNAGLKFSKASILVSL
jgi:hypothetical protein